MKKLYRKMLLSVLTMIVCSVIFCSSTFAWFTAQRRVTVASVTAADYSLSIKLDEREVGTAASQGAVEYTCPSAEGAAYTFTITAGGTAKTGYCEIEMDGQTYRTEQIPKDESITLTIQAEQETVLIFSANWGEYDGNEERYGNENPILVSNTPPQMYTITLPLPTAEDPITEETTEPAEGEATIEETTGPAENSEPTEEEEPARPAEDDEAAPDTEKAADPSVPTAPPASLEGEESRGLKDPSGSEAEED